MALLFFFVLQLCDAATTLVFLRHGIHEANPLIAGLLRVFSEPALAVFLIKLGGCGLAAYAWKTHRIRLLRRANIFFALCVGWNLLAICGAWITG
jgi:hypothetical protein